MIRRIMPLAFGNFDVRSMTTFVETENLKGGWQKLSEKWAIIKNYALDFEVLVLFRALQRKNRFHKTFNTEHKQKSNERTVLFIEAIKSLPKNLEIAEDFSEVRIITAAEFSGRMVKWMRQ